MALVDTLPLPEADVLLVVPPCAHLTWPSLGVHLLQGAGRRTGFEVRVLYANALFADLAGLVDYCGLCNSPGDWLLGERVFRNAAYGLPALGADADAFLEGLRHPLAGPDATAQYLDQLSDVAGMPYDVGSPTYSRARLEELSAFATEFAERLAARIAARGYRVVGASTCFDQTAASLALLHRVKAADPGVTTVLGGANCEGEMADGLLTVAPGVDHVFAGEADESFPAFLADMAGAPRVIRGRPVADLDALPSPDFEDYFEQVGRLPMDGTPLWISYETSRGCWWGEKHHCTFCGLNGTGMGFRQKSPERVFAELRSILSEAPTRRVAMTDNIMPHAFHRSVVPRLPEELPETHIFYEQKANLSLAQVRALVDGGISVIQPGIESLSSSVLRLMDKGVLARQNVALLRYAKSVGLGLKWNLLYALPGDDAEEYAAMTRLLPLLQHLTPPNALTHLSLDRFSPYVERPAEHGVEELRPWKAYAAVLPEGADARRIAYHFDGSWRSGSKEAPGILGDLFAEVTRWRAAWSSDPPVLQVSRISPGRYGVIDRREVAPAPWLVLDQEQAQAVLVGGPYEKVPRADWAVRARLAVELDGWCVPLVVAAPDLLAELEAQTSRSTP